VAVAPEHTARLTALPKSAFLTHGGGAAASPEHLVSALAEPGLTTDAEPYRRAQSLAARVSSVARDMHLDEAGGATIVAQFGAAPAAAVR